MTEDDTRPLLALLADRQKLSTELTRIAGRLAPVRRDWAAFRDSLSPPQKTEADGLVEEAAQRLRRLIESDERDARLLSIRKRVTGDALRATHATGQAMSAYRMRSERAAGGGATGRGFIMATATATARTRRLRERRRRRRRTKRTWLRSCTFITT